MEGTSVFESVVQHSSFPNSLQLQSVEWQEGQNGMWKLMSDKLEVGTEFQILGGLIAAGIDVWCGELEICRFNPGRASCFGSLPFSFWAIPNARGRGGFKVQSTSTSKHILSTLNPFIRYRAPV